MPLFRMVAEFGLYAAYKKYMVLDTHVYIQSSPKTRLMAAQTLEKDASNTLRLIPWTYSLNDKEEGQSKGKLNAKLLLDNPMKFEIKAPIGLDKKVEVEFWRVGEEKKDAKFANLKWSKVTENVHWPFDIGYGQKVEVEIPCLVLSKDVQVDTELHVFCRPHETSKRLAVGIAGPSGKSSDNKVARTG